MTDDQSEITDRPLSEVDDLATRLQSSGSAGDSGGFDLRPAQDAVDRIVQDPRPLVAALVAIVVIIVAAALLGRRSQPKTTEELLMERSREALDRSRDALEQMLAKAAATIDR